MVGNGTRFETVKCPKCGNACRVMDSETPKRKFEFVRYYATCEVCNIDFRTDIHEGAEPVRIIVPEEFIGDVSKPDVHCPREKKRVPIWWCVGSLVQRRERCPHMVKAKADFGKMEAEVRCKYKSKGQ